MDYQTGKDVPMEAIAHGRQSTSSGAGVLRTHEKFKGAGVGIQNRVPLFWGTMLEEVRRTLEAKLRHLGLFLQSY